MLPAEDEPLEPAPPKSTEKVVHAYRKSYPVSSPIVKKAPTKKSVSKKVDTKAKPTTKKKK